MLDSSNIASCVCNPGYELADDGVACIGNVNYICSHYGLLCNCLQ